MILYEQYQRGAEEIFSISYKSNLNFEVHLHRCFEFIYVEDGELTVEINNKAEMIKKGYAALILPNQLHSYKTSINSTSVLLIFSPELVGRFTNLLENKIPNSNLFEVENIQDIDFSDMNNIFKKKSILYKICGLFLDKNILIDKNAGKKDKSLNLLQDILVYIDDNYKNYNCSLRELSREIGYDYAYLSRVFSNSVKISYSDYINHYRINFACYLLKNTNNTITEISQECGFNSIRSFNRNFKKVTGVTPRYYRITL